MTLMNGECLTKVKYYNTKLKHLAVGSLGVALTHSCKIWLSLKLRVNINVCVKAYALFGRKIQYTCDL